MTQAPTYSRRYESRWSDHKRSFEQVVREDIFHRSWDSDFDLPAVPVEANLSHALVCLYAGQRELAGPFLERAISYANELESESRFHDTEVAQAGYPLSHAEVIRARALARWLLGEPLSGAHQWRSERTTWTSITRSFCGLDRDDLRKAAEMYVAWCLTKAEDRKRFVSSFTMSIYLQGVRCALMANELDYASELLETKQPLLWHHGRECELWTQLAETYPAMEANLRVNIESFFDRVRDPDFQEVLDGLPTSIDREALALDTGIIRQTYVVNATAVEPVDPKAVIEAVAY